MNRISWNQDGSEQQIEVDEAQGRVQKLQGKGSIDLTITLPDGQIVTLFMSTRRAFLMQLKAPGDVGRVATRQSHEAADWRFTLANGQEDVYPDEMTLPRDLAIAIVMALISNRPMPDGVDWTT